MAKDHPDSTSKKEKKHKSKSTSDENGVKKSKKEKRAKADTADDVGTERVVVVPNVKDEDGDQVMDTAAEPAAVSSEPLLGELVPFANPLADEKVTKKVLKGVKRAAKHKHLKRGVKEVVKSLRKSSAPASAIATPAIVVLAADISPLDVISHIPVLCEDHSVPYIYVRSRAALGAAGATKRPTSVVMLVPPGKGGAKKEKEKGEDEAGEEEWAETFGDLVKVVEKASRNVRI